MSKRDDRLRLFYFTGRSLLHDEFIRMLKKEAAIKTWTEINMNNGEYWWVDYDGNKLPQFRTDHAAGIQFESEEDLVACRLVLGI